MALELVLDKRYRLVYNIVIVNGREQIDIQLSNHGSIILIHPVSSEGQDWMDENLPEDAPMMGSAVACEPRYIVEIINGAQADGLSVGE